MYKLIGVFAGIISMIAFVPYIISILKKETQPSRASWIIWTVVALMILSSYKMSGAVETIWVPVSYFLGPFVVAILSVKYGVGGWTRMDRF